MLDPFVQNSDVHSIGAAVWAADPIAVKGEISILEVWLEYFRWLH